MLGVCMLPRHAPPAKRGPLRVRGGARADNPPTETAPRFAYRSQISLGAFAGDDRGRAVTIKHVVLRIEPGTITLAVDLELD
jgi:hypothetical protein